MPLIRYQVDVTSWERGTSLKKVNWVINWIETRLAKGRVFLAGR